MSLCVVLLRTEHRTGLKDSVEHADHHLFVELRALCQDCRSVEVLEFKEVRAALCGFRTDLRGMDLGESLACHKLAEAAADTFLDAEFRALTDVPQCDGTAV